MKRLLEPEFVGCFLVCDVFVCQDNEYVCALTDRNMRACLCVWEGERIRGTSWVSMRPTRSEGAGRPHVTEALGWIFTQCLLVCVMHDGLPSTSVGQLASLAFSPWWKISCRNMMVSLKKQRKPHFELNEYMYGIHLQEERNMPRVLENMLDCL